MLSLLAWTPGPWELVIVAAVVLLIFGHRLPSLLRSLGAGVQSFQQGLRSGDSEAEPANRASKS